MFCQGAGVPAFTGVSIHWSYPLYIETIITLKKKVGAFIVKLDVVHHSSLAQHNLVSFITELVIGITRGAVTSFKLTY